MKMLKIGITQRAEYFETFGETRDALDQNWTKLLQANGCLAVPVPNVCYVSDFIEALSLDGILMSGGDDHPMRERCETACIDYCVQHKMPLLGICHGMQFIARYFGATLLNIEGHVKVRHDVFVYSNPYEIPQEQFEVNSFHRFTLDKVPNDFSSFAADKEGHCEAMYHSTLPIAAFMWHPERVPYLDWFGDFLRKFYEKR